MAKTPRLIAAAEAEPGNPDATLALAGSARVMHRALRRVARLWGPCPGGRNNAPIYTAGPEFGTLGDLRAVTAALHAVEG